MMNENNALAALLASAAAGLFVAAALKKEKEKTYSRKAKTCWVKKFRENRKFASTQTLLRELQCSTGDYKHGLRIDESCFNKILSYIKSDIQRKNTLLREAVPAETKLAVTLRYLAKGETFLQLDRHTSLSTSFIATAVFEVCDAIYEKMENEFLKFPTEKEEWSKIAQDFNLNWQFPLCIGALDTKHIALTPLNIDAPLYYNDKGFHSIVLLALADAYSRFTFIDVGCHGRTSNSDVLHRSDFMNILRQPDKYLPSKKDIGNSRTLPHVFVADNTFPLLENMMTPYFFTASHELKKNFNRRLTRPRQAIQRAFGILTNRFQILQKNLKVNEVKVKKIVKCCCILHNFLIENSTWYAGSASCIENPIENDNEITMDSSFTITKHSKTSENVRKLWVEYFSNEGKI